MTLRTPLQITYLFCVDVLFVTEICVVWVKLVVEEPDPANVKLADALALAKKTPASALVATVPLIDVVTVLALFIVCPTVSEPPGACDVQM